jgi:LPXTG-motif cell wall-anchored protein
LVLTSSPAGAQEVIRFTEFDCNGVTVTGAGWEQTDATVEVAVPPSEGGESREDLIAGPVQVFPDADGNIPPTVVPFNRTPPDGDYAAVVLVDNIVRGQSPGFTLTGCGEDGAGELAEMPRTGTGTTAMVAGGVGMLAVGAGLVFYGRKFHPRHLAR